MPPAFGIWFGFYLLRLKFYCNTIAIAIFVVYLQHYCTECMLTMKQLFFLLSFSLLFFQCKKQEDVVPTDDNELITTVQLVFTDAANQSTTFTFQDKDGDPKTAAEKFDKISLNKNTDYSLAIKLLDETKSPALDLTKQIEDESDSHLFIYKVNPASLLNIMAADLDKNGIPVGIKSKGKSQYAPGTGKFRVILKHQPPVNGKRIKTGDEDGGSTDVDLEFDLTIK